ncbi:MAG: tRNA (cytidine(34)-2'-O)-methyltransferase [Firmicutes bacterium]|nr:tRNA (cytidine(34)-2'-O)-methyltransferase [Bacillota bacterium]MBQ1525423.1 tRNA (cytidine(34)-2'-O)-methyltransferase [Bacillota bacterium]MBQ1887169.1 tRNA (cytidine(34)-2'-O)-methyltransferase [Bacillota bacterium]MBQ2455944.1 tRNA (cytidine(34)-2'-O)-methyltransferase [Bacillota bacterium]MBQ4180974.1 tRNA (cytidine(34)-2'-O)-methyltransferase [Bacillota bacterium]
MALHVVLVEPEIHFNTGNIARTCAITGAVLHLVKPLGFEVTDRHLKRAGLDYWPYVTIEYHDSFSQFLEEYAGRRMHLATTKGAKLYTQAEYRDGDMILFGKESAGLPRPFIEEHKDMAIRIPMSADTRARSLNLSNSVAIIVFEAFRQWGFPGLE